MWKPRAASVAMLDAADDRVEVRAIGQLELEAHLGHPIGSGDGVAGEDVDVVVGHGVGHDALVGAVQRAGHVGATLDGPLGRDDDVEKQVAEGDEALMEEFFDKGTLPKEDLVAGLTQAVRAGRLERVRALLAEDALIAAAIALTVLSRSFWQS